MSDLHKQVFSAIEDLPRPVTPEQALKTGLDIIQDQRAKDQWKAWIATNGAQLVYELNKE